MPIGGNYVQDAIARAGRFGNHGRLEKYITKRMPVDAGPYSQIPHAQEAVMRRGRKRMMIGAGVGGAALLSGMNGRSSGVQGIAPRSSGGYA